MYANTNRAGKYFKDRADFDEFFKARTDDHDHTYCLVCDRVIRLSNGVDITSGEGDREYGISVKMTGIGIHSGKVDPLVSGISIQPKPPTHQTNQMVCRSCISAGIENLPAAIKALKSPMTFFQVFGMAFAGSVTGIAVIETLWALVR